MDKTGGCDGAGKILWFKLIFGLGLGLGISW